LWNIAVFKINFIREHNFLIHVLSKSLMRIISPLAATTLLFDDVFIGKRAGQAVTHMRSTNSKPQPSNQALRYTSQKGRRSQL